MNIVDDNQAAIMDREFCTALAQISGGTPPLELSLATLDWLAHLSISPGKRLQLTQSFFQKLGEVGIYSLQPLVKKDAEGPASAIERRMSSEVWRRSPFTVFAQAHQLSKDWWKEATVGIEGVRVLRSSCGSAAIWAATTWAGPSPRCAPRTSFTRVP